MIVSISPPGEGLGELSVSGASSRVRIARLGVARAGDYRTIRLAALEESPAAFGSDYETERARPDAAFAERVAGTAVFGAYLAEALAGMVGFRREDGLKDRHKGHLWGMYVRPEARGTGAAAALMDAVLAHAAGEVEQVTLTVVQGNEPALRLYERYGFETYGIEPRAHKTPAGYADEILMVRFFHRDT
jgi:ribosomal protein S18 acetylase RimI-like enzyme